ncbi:MFS general substrate transporter [Sistotremastrum suecicum HHB10207 ss-3]|uniref:MFS general substrate transporter n=1 Tax=Sistotremastrum suecicum HHB10207 ss-3 TaxID=1314776 RepID=A0A166J8A5_9AGAM|nr:MFS general substrate transporter [Sistotremastrum suecicum HHB10207 ss-3]
MASKASTRRNSMNAGDSTSTSDETLPTNHEEIKIGAADRTKDFGFLPIPARLRYNPEKPAHFGLLLNVVFGFASTLTVANLYYCQPLLIQLSIAFGVSYDEVSKIPTLTQAGYATGLLLISPIGDLVPRRPLLLGLILSSASLCIGLSVTKSLKAFEAISFLLGAVTVTPQIMIPLAADLAPPNRRASAMSIVMSGLLFGILLARVLAGVIAEFSSWRNTYYMAFAAQYLMAIVLYLVLPDYPAKNAHLTYFGILRTMAKFAVTEPVLIQACLISLASSATFTNFWVTLTFLLGGTPYFYDTLQIGLFGLIGMLGVATAPLVGRLIDRMVPWFATLIATLILIVFQCVLVGAAGINIAAVIIACFGIDVGRQMQQVSLTTAVFAVDPAARSRMNAVLIVFIFLGQVMGTSVGSRVFLQFGWRPAAALSLAWNGWQLFVLLLRGPHCQRFTWLGWEGGAEMRKQKSTEKSEDVEKQPEERIESSDSSETAPTRQGELPEKSRTEVQ